MIVTVLFICIILQEIQIIVLRKESERLETLVRGAIMNGIEVKFKEHSFHQKNDKDNTGE